MAATMNADDAVIFLACTHRLVSLYTCRQAAASTGCYQTDRTTFEADKVNSSCHQLSVLMLHASPAHDGTFGSGAAMELLQ